ncbi:MAG: hypothetical protein H7241_01295, partial [Novosphingobium sp.]|nr:hypothetical protein [Novosphingobium sp.]
MTRPAIYRVIGAACLFAFCTSLSGCQQAQRSDEEPPAAMQASDSAAPPTGPRSFCKATRTRETSADCTAFADDLQSLKAGFEAFQPDKAMVRDATATVRYSITLVPEIAQGGEGEIATAAADDVAEATPPSVDASPKPVIIKSASMHGTPPVTRKQIDDAVAEASNAAKSNVVKDADAATARAAPIKVGQQMYACLTGDPAFRIEPKDCVSKSTVEDPAPVWTWQVTPTKSGVFKLYLKSGVALEGEDGKLRRLGNVSPAKEITVTVSALGRFQDALAALTQWVQSPVGLIVALTSLLAVIGGLFAAWRKLRKGGNEASGSKDDTPPK